MTTQLDSEALAAAIAIRDEVGRDVTVDAFTLAPSAATGAVTETPITGSPLTVKVPPPSAVKWKLGDDTVRQDMLQVLFVNDSLGAWAPELGKTAGFRVTIDGVAYTPVGVDPIYTGDDVVAWRAYLRR